VNFYPGFLKSFAGPRTLHEKVITSSLAQSSFLQLF